MLRKIIAAFIAAYCFTMAILPIQAAPSGRWHYVNKDDILQIDYYYDEQSASYDAANHTITFWLFKYRDGKKYIMSQVCLNLDKKTFIVPIRVYYSSGHANTMKNEKPPEHTVVPDSTEEKAGDELCDKFHLAHMYPKSANRWQWLTSTDHHTINYAADCIEIDRNNHKVAIWTQEVGLDGYKSDPNRYICDIANNKLVFNYGGGGHYHEIVILPESFEEIVFNKAKSIYYNQK